MKSKKDTNKVKYPWIKNRDEKGYTALSETGIYSNKRWIDLRNYKLQLNPLCEHCLKDEILEHAVLVDHKVRVFENDDPLFYDLDNLQSLCDTCHRRKTRLDNSKFSDANLAKGKNLMNFFEND